MKQVITAIAVFIQLSFSTQSQKEFIINGSIKGLPDGTILYFVKDGGTDTLTRTMSRNGKFTFKGTLPGEGVFYFIMADTAVLATSSKPLLMTSATITVQADITKWPELKVKGSEAQREWLQYKELEKVANEKYGESTKIYINSYYALQEARKKGDSSAARQLAAETQVLQAKYEEITYELSMCMPNFITNYPGSYVSAFLLRMFPMEKIRQYYPGLLPGVKNSYYGLQLQHRLKTGSLEAGETVQDFSGITPGGKKLSLYEILGKGQYTLVDFWASWCSPCRAGNPLLKEALDKYKSKGFNILSISVDKNATQWKNAIEKDGMNWYHIIDEEGIANKYWVYDVPAYVLLDKHGKIVASSYDDGYKKITARMLGETLKGLLEK